MSPMYGWGLLNLFFFQFGPQYSVETWLNWHHNYFEVHRSNWSSNQLSAQVKLEVELTRLQLNFKAQVMLG